MMIKKTLKRILVLAVVISTIISGFSFTNHVKAEPASDTELDAKLENIAWNLYWSDYYDPYSASWDYDAALETVAEIKQELKSFATGENELNYACFGAAGDGKQNDYQAIYKTHRLANMLHFSGIDVTVYGNAGKTYYISTADKIIDIITDVDWRGCTFIIDDYYDGDSDGINDVKFNEPVFDIVADMKAATGSEICVNVKTPEAASINNDKAEMISSLSGYTISSSTKNVSKIINVVKETERYKYMSEVAEDFDSCDIWGAYIESDTKRWYRSGNESSGTNTGEMITFNGKTGELITGVDFSYNPVSRIKVFPIRNKTISVGNATFITKSFNQVYPDSKKNAYSYRGIRVRYTGNINIHNINHVLDEDAHPFTSDYQKEKRANYYYGFIYLQYNAYMIIDGVNLSAHTPALQKGSTTNYEGSYDLTIDNTAFVYLKNIGYGDYSRDMLDDSKWGVTGTNQNKYLFIESCKMNRIDSHRGITDLLIKNSILGVKGITMIGQGKFYAENLVFDQAGQAIQLRQDYGATWTGDMYFKNVAFRFSNELHSYVFYANNTENKNFGYRSIFPNVYMDGVSVTADTTIEPIFLWFNQSIKSTRDNSSSGNNLYYFGGSIKVSNLTMNNVKTFNVFTYHFPRNDDGYNLLLSSYGGNNQVTLDLDSKMNINATLSSKTKFKKGSVSADFSGTKTYLEGLYQKGLTVIDTDFECIPAETVSLSDNNLSMLTGDVQILKASAAPVYSAHSFSFSSDKTSVVTVDESGKLTAKGAGKAVVTVTEQLSGKQATCNVTVTGDAAAPELIAIYNSANGADIRFAPSGATVYYIMRKENGTWKQIKEVSASSLTKDGDNFKYIDSSVKTAYGKGYIYSVAVKTKSGTLNYNTGGLALYRLSQPKITSVVYLNVKAVVTWDPVDCFGYEVQYSDDNGKTWTAVPETSSTSITMDGLSTDKAYVFRVRCEKTNSSRGTTWSQYSGWKALDAITLEMPSLVAIYNSANGADIRFSAVDGALSYIIMRKENGVWKEVASVDAKDIANDETNLKYVDSSVKSAYGKGYIYSVKAKGETGSSFFGQTGLALYRLAAPKITSIKNASSGKVTLTWSKTECQGYEVQYSSDGGSTWKKAPETVSTTQTIDGLAPGTSYAFRVRCQKTNASRGTTWSPYSGWSNIAVK